MWNSVHILSGVAKMAKKRSVPPLQLLERSKELKCRGSYDGPDRYLVNLQALGAWRGTAPIGRPTDRELFAIRFSRLSAEPASGLLTCEANTSPAPQVSGPGGE